VVPNLVEDGHACSKQRPLEAVKTNAWDIRPAPVHSPEAARIIREYVTDVAARYHGRPATRAEVDAELAADPSDDLAPPGGRFWLAHRGGAPVGCVAIRLIAPGVAELKRMYVRPEARGSGCGAALVAAAERGAVQLGARVVRLDTRHDLVEARRLYVRSGYAEIPAYNDSRWARRWYEKRLAAGPPVR